MSKKEKKKKKKKSFAFAPVTTLLSVLTAKALNTNFAIPQTIKSAVSAEEAASFEDVAYFVSSAGLIAYRKLGDGYPIVLLHDVSCTSAGSDWMELALLLSQKYTVYVPDLPGCGLSDQLHTDYTNTIYMTFLEEFLTKEVHSPALLIAFGLSSTFALTLSQLHPELIWKLTLLNPGVLSPISLKDGIKKSLLRVLLEVPGLGKPIYQFFYSNAKIEAAINEKYYFNAFKSPSSYVDRAISNASNQGKGRVSLFRSLLLGQMDFNITHILKDPQIPIRVLFGEKEAGREAMSQEISSLNPSIAISVIPNTKHMPHLEDPEITAQHLAE